jgi:hypothetical protein
MKSWRNISRSLRDVRAGKNERFGSKPASLAAGRIKTGSAAIRSAKETIASSLRRKSKSSVADSVDV